MWYWNIEIVSASFAQDAQAWSMGISLSLTESKLLHYLDVMKWYYVRSFCLFVCFAKTFYVPTNIILYWSLANLAKILKSNMKDTMASNLAKVHFESKTRHS